MPPPAEAEFTEECCTRFTSICRYMGACTQAEEYWRQEIQNPMVNQSITRGDLVIIDKTKEAGDVGFFGVIIDFSDTGIVAYTPMGATVSKRREDIIKVRLIPTARQWRGSLLAQALRTGIIGLIHPSTGSAETDMI